MPDHWRRLGAVILVVLLTAFAYEPLLHAGLLGEDYSVLRAVDDAGFRFAALYDVPGTNARPLGAFSISASVRLWNELGWWQGSSGAWLLRAENLVWLLLAAVGVMRILMRAMRPWMGTDQARSAGMAAAMLLLVHPLSVSSVARIASRGDLIAMALGSWCVASFLRGRQSSRFGFVALAAGLATVAAFCSPIAIFLPVALAGMEYVSARRHRPRPTRLRTANNTLFVFAGCVALEWIGRATRRTVTIAVTQVHVESPLALEGTPLDQLGLALEKLGIMMLPVSDAGLGVIGYVLAGAVVLLALHPASIAARSAPRLWLRVLLGWLVSMGAAEYLDVTMRVYPGSLANAHSLLAAAGVMAVGLAVASTALSGARRVFIPGSMIVLYAVIAHGNAVPWRDSSRLVQDLHADLLQAARARDWRTHVLVLDPPSTPAGRELVRASLPYLLDPLFHDHPTLAAPDRPVWVRAISRDAFRAFIREHEFASLRERGLMLLVPEELVLEPADPAARVAIDLPRDPAPTTRQFWRGAGRAPSASVMSGTTIAAISVAALPESATNEPPRVRWSAASAPITEGSSAGVWLKSADGPVAVFDLNADYEWLLSGRVRSLWLVGSALTTIVSAELMTRAPTFGANIVPQPVGSDWIFNLAEVTLPRADGGEGELVLGLLDIETMTYEELAIESLGSSMYVARGALERVESAQTKVGGPVAWHLDYRVDGQCVTRATGRRMQLRESKGQ